MSKVTTVTERLVSVLGGMFPDKTRIPYAYSLPDNNKNLYVNGWGLLIGEQSFQEHDFCSIMNSLVVSVVFTREVKRLSSDADPVDSVVRQLLEDVYTVQQKFYSYDELEIEESIAKVDIVSTTAPTELITDKQSFLSMTANFNFFIRELLT